MTTTISTEDKKKGWAEAAAASAAAQEPGDPPPKRFRARLTCMLADSQLVVHGRQYADAEQELEEFDAKTKQISTDRKALRAEIEGRKKKHRQILSTGREDRDIDCVEHVSLRQGRKWRVRLDSNETYAEEPLSETDRQACLPIDLADPEDPEDGQLALPKAPPGADAEEESSEIDVTDPESLLDAAEAGDDEDDGDDS